MNKNTFTNMIGKYSKGTYSRVALNAFAEILAIHSKGVSFDKIKILVSEAEDFVKSIPLYPAGQLP